MDTDELLDTVRGWIADAERITVLTGAGISTDSGIPDFRGPNGVWTKDPGAERSGDDPALPGRPRHPPAGVSARRQPGVRGAPPNAGHAAVVASWSGWASSTPS